MQGAGNIDHRAPAEEGRDRSRIERGRHYQDAQIRSRQPRLLREGETQIGMDAALVKFVDDDGRDVGEERILLQVCRQDAFGDDDQPRVVDAAALEANVPADLPADGPAALACNPPRHRPGCHPARLQQQHLAAIDERRRHARGLAGARRRNQHRGAGAFEGLCDARDEGINGQNRRHGVSSKLTARGIRRFRRVERVPGT
jgi:hypothetical protein